jgi:peptidoglycan hydrolase-like protein with peptidoglycan-binding domain
MKLLKKGCVGQDVKSLQAVLNFHMLDAPNPLIVDGIFGPKTKKRTLEFQEEFKLDTDGIVGDLTGAALGTFVESQQHLLIVRTPRYESPGLEGAAPSAPATPPMNVMLPPKLHPYPEDPTRTPDNLFIHFTNHLELGIEGSLEVNITHPLKSKSHKNEINGFAVANMTALWSRKVKDRVSFGLGMGVLHERLLQKERESETKAYLFYRMQLKTFELEWGSGNAFGAPLRVEVQFTPKLMDVYERHRAFCATANFGPELSFLHDRIAIGLGGIGRYCFDGHKQHTLSGIFGASASFRFGPRAHE